MPAKTAYIPLATQGRHDVIDLTQEVRKIVSANAIDSGIVTVFAPGSTAGVTTIECEPGLKKDLDIFLEKIAPWGDRYYHHDTWHDDNGSSHIQAALIGPAITIPVVNGDMTLGTWQQIVLIDCDTKPRTRDIVVQMVY